MANTIPIISRQQEIEDLRELVEKTRRQLEKALCLTVDLSTRNSELRSAIRATINDYPALPLRRLHDVLEKPLASEGESD